MLINASNFQIPTFLPPDIPFIMPKNSMYMCPNISQENKNCNMFTWWYVVSILVSGWRSAHHQPPPPKVVGSKPRRGISSSPSYEWVASLLTLTPRRRRNWPHYSIMLRLREQLRSTGMSPTLIDWVWDQPYACHGKKYF